MTTNITNDDDDDDDDKVGKWTVYHEAALSTDDVWRLRDVSTVHKIVVRVIEFAVAEFQLDEKVLQYLIVDLSQRQHARKQPVVMVTSTKLIGAHRHVIAMATRISSRHRHRVPEEITAVIKLLLSLSLIINTLRLRYDTLREPT